MTSSDNAVITSKCDDGEPEVTSRNMDEYREYEMHQDRVLRMRLDMLGDHVYNYGLTTEHCWDLLKIANLMISEGYGSYILFQKRDAFKHVFGDFATWQSLYDECRYSIP